MALFTDGQINTLQDLQRYESGLLSLMSMEQIDAAGKMALAQDLIASDLLEFLLREGPRHSLWPVGLSSGARRRIGVTDVVVTAPLQRWHALRTIELVYQDAYGNQLNDRYQNKWKQYQQQATDAGAAALSVGIGLVLDPIRVADQPLVLSVDGNNAGATYYAQMTWTNRSGQEGQASELVSLNTAGATQLVVSPVNAPGNAAGWNVYVGTTPENISLQNAAPLGLGVDWVMPGTVLQFGRAVGEGQTPDRYFSNDRVLQRG